jgi:hypothetical protein
MAAKRAPNPSLPGMTVPRLDRGDDDELVAYWPVHRYRFLLADGRTVDVVSFMDDSRLRGVLVDTMGASIVGVAELNGKPPDPPS